MLPSRPMSGVGGETPVVNGAKIRVFPHTLPSESMLLGFYPGDATNRNAFLQVELRPTSLSDLRNCKIPDGLTMLVNCHKEGTIRWSSRLVKIVFKDGQTDERLKFISHNTGLDATKRPFRHTYYASDCIDLPLYHAYEMKRRPWADKRDPKDCFQFSTTLTHCPYKLRILKRIFEVDETLHSVFEPCNVVHEMPQLEELPIVDKHFKYGDTGDLVDPLVFNAFKAIVDRAIKEATQSNSMTGYNLGDLLVHPEMVKFCDVRKHIPVSELLEVVIKHGFNNVVGCFPKPGCYKSGGKLRYVYPMHLSYECALRTWLGEAKVDLPFVARSFMDFPKADDLHSYDLTSSETQIWPYFIKYCKDAGLEAMIPVALYPDGSLRELDRFPSGIYGTGLFSTAFTIAKCRIATGGDPLCVQGDGFLLRQSITVEGVRESPRDTLNGFRLTHDRPVFINTHKLRALRAYKSLLNGVERAAVLLTTYRLLGATHLPEIDISVEHDGVPYKDWTAKELGAFLRERNQPIPHHIKALMGNTTPNTTGWDMFRVVGATETIHDLSPLPTHRLMLN